MPTYDYLCSACGHELELFHSMTEAPKRKCPACGKLKLTRRIGRGAGIIFKGSGFYETDYRSESYKKGAEAETKSTTGDSKAKTDAGTAGTDAKAGSDARAGSDKKAG